MKWSKPTYRTKDNELRALSCHYGTFRDHHDRSRRVRGSTDLQASEQFGRKVEQLVGLRATQQMLGADMVRWLEQLSDYHRGKLDEWDLLDARAATLAEDLSGHVDDCHDAKLAGGKTTRYAKQLRTRVMNVVNGCGFARWGDLKVGPIEQWLANQRNKGAISEQTSNHYVTALKTFCNWMVADGRAAASPLDRLKGVKVTDSKERGFLLPEQMQTLLRHTWTGTTWPVNKSRTLAGRSRCLIYRFAAETGLRADVIRNLRPDAFRFDRDPDGTVTGGDVMTGAARQKNRTRHSVRLRPEFAELLAEHVAALHPDTPVFALPEKPVPMLHADLEAAGLPKVDENGGTPIDFHSFRHSCASWLMAEGVDVLTVCAITGHKDPAMVLKRYGHAMKHKVREAVTKFPDLRMTGTDPADAPPASACAIHEIQQADHGRVRPRMATGDIRNSHRTDSNRQPAVYKTAALPLSYGGAAYVLIVIGPHAAWTQSSGPAVANRAGMSGVGATAPARYIGGSMGMPMQ